MNAGRRLQAQLAGPISGAVRSVGSVLHPDQAFFVAVILLFASPLLLDTYSLNVFNQAFAFAIVVVTLDLLWGYTGILSYAQSTFFAIGGYAVGLAFAHLGFVPAVVGLALLAGLATAVVVAVLIGLLAFHSRASWLFVAVVTFAVPVVFKQLVLSGGEFTGSSSGLSGFPTVTLPFVGWYWLFGILLLVVLFVAHRVVTSDAGRILVAIRENEERCRYLGLETSRIKIIVFASCAAVAALSGAAYAASADVVAPGFGDFVLGTQFVIWTAVGGRGTLFGPVLATIAINVVSARLTGSLPFVWTLLIGLLFVVVVIYAPAGAWPIVRDSLQKVLKKMRIGASRTNQPSAPLVVGSRNDGRPTRPRSIKIAGVRKTYGSLTVLNGVDLAAESGEIVGIIGPNGAGKTTLMRCISDGRERSGGTVEINGVPIGTRSPQRCVELGLGRKFQIANVFPELTVADCLVIARANESRPSLWSKSKELVLPDSAVRVVNATGLHSVLELRAKQLSHGMKQALELAMVLAAEPDVILLDEPTAGLSADERAAIGALLVDLARTNGLCILLVEHDLDFVREISTRLVVLHQGRVLLDGSVQEIVASDLVRTIYAGSVGATV